MTMITLSPTSFTLTELPKNVKAGNFVSIGEGVLFYSEGTHQAAFNHKAVFTTHFEQTNEADLIEIGHDVWVGRNSVIFGGVKIGTGAIVGSHSVVTKDVPDFAVVVGNPARITRIRFTAKQIASLMKIGWWFWSRKEVLDKIDLMKDVDKFIKKYEKEN